MDSMKKLKTFAAAVAITMVAAAILTPTASAQSSSTLTFDTVNVSYEQGDSNAIVPDTGRAKITFAWDYAIDNPGYDRIGVAQRQTLLQFSDTSCDDGSLQVSGAQSIPVSLQETDGSPKTGDAGEATFFVSATQQAPGEQPIGCSFTGSVKASGQNQIEKSNEDIAKTEVVVKYLGLISTTIPTTIKQAAPQKQIEYNLEVSNLGNSLTNVRFELRDGEGASEGGWNPVPPTPVVLQSEAQGGTDTVKSVNFLISTPFKNGWNNKEKTFTLDITPESTKNPDLKGGAVTVNVLARVRGVYVPSMEPMVLVGAVIGTALVARLLREDEE